MMYHPNSFLNFLILKGKFFLCYLNWCVLGWKLYWQVGICGEHGGEPSSVAFFAKAGLDYVSCSPFRLEALLYLDE